MRRLGSFSRHRKGEARAGALACLLALALILSGRGAALAEAPYDAEEVVLRLLHSHELPEGLSFRQEVTVRALLVTWRFHSEVETTSEGLKSRIVGAPSFVPETLPLDLVNLSRSPELFDLKVAAEPSSDGSSLVLQGPRIGYAGVGPREATFWVDPETWTIRRAEAEYSWGTLFLDQTFDRFGEFYLLSEQRARVTPYGFTLDVRYREYRLP